MSYAPKAFNVSVIKPICKKPLVGPSVFINQSPTFLLSKRILEKIVVKKLIEGSLMIILASC